MVHWGAYRGYYDDLGRPVQGWARRMRSSRQRRPLSRTIMQQAGQLYSAYMRRARERALALCKQRYGCYPTVTQRRAYHRRL
jgi:hypothetical protein